MVTKVSAAGGFSGCDGCEWNGDIGRYSLTVSTKCGNAHVEIGGNLYGTGGDIGENVRVRDCNGTPGGGVKSIIVCAGDGWSLFRC
ncbi:hypothetical protein IFR04_004817 [Cadophora malorum]|uniref:Uncharacterized protein n=1 Tax=Cadophora malorum TaxID=108018 RepID=A0A8H8BRH2_9HELO|nr:hypothetical protein IFR04_004817 [Cadophora malorum]